MSDKAKYIAALGGTLVFASPFLMQHLQKWEEGPRRQLVVYADKLAGGLPTVCMGLTKYVTSTSIIVGQRWTEEKCSWPGWR
jgi:lysozyme